MKNISNIFNIKTLLGVFVLIISYFIFYSTIKFNVNTDIQAHSRFVQDFMNGNANLPGHFFYFGLTYLLFFLTKNLDLASIIILTLFTTFKFYVNYYIIKDYLRLKKISDKVEEWKILITSFTLLFVFSLPSIQTFTNKYYYLGQFTPNVWHNSTTIFLMPFALLLFWVSYKQLLEHQTKRMYIIGLLLALNIFSKPSFFLIFVVVYPLFLLHKYKLSKTFFLNLIPIVFGSVLLILEYIFIYEKDPNSSVVFSFLKSWNVWFPTWYIIPSLITSFAFPITFFIYNRSKLNYLNTYVLSLLVFALSLLFFLTETGERCQHGNFFWQVFIASNILFLMIMAQILGERNYSKNKLVVILFMYGLHLVSGVAYLSRYFLTQSFL